VVVTGREVADVEPRHAERRDLRDLPLGQEAIRDPALVEHLDGPRVEAARARAHDLGAGVALDDGDLDAGQRELRGQHQAGWPCAGAHDRTSRAHRSPILRPATGLAASPGSADMLRTEAARNGATSIAPQIIRTSARRHGRVTSATLVPVIAAPSGDAEPRGEDQTTWRNSTPKLRPATSTRARTRPATRGTSSVSTRRPTEGSWAR